MRASRFLTNFEISSEEISKNRKNFETAREGNFDISFYFLVYTAALVYRVFFEKFRKERKEGQESFIIVEHKREKNREI